MLVNRNILCLSNPLWEGDYAKTIVELISVLAKQNKVLYVDNAYTVKDIMDGIRGKRRISFKQVFGLKKRTKKITLHSGAEVYVLTPPMILTINFLPKGFFYHSLLHLNGWFVRKAIKRTLHRLEMEDNLLHIVAFNPAMGVVNGKKFNEKLLLYYCYDEINAAQWLKKHGLWLEKKLMSIVHATIVTSQGLFETKKAFSNKCFLVKNAVNVELFIQGFTEIIHSEKRIGYIGSIDDRLDYELLEKMLISFPLIEFVFVGRIMYKPGEVKLRKYNNVSIIGPKPIEELPAYLKTFAVGIIPFLKNEFTKGIYPLKINEYLAAGLPVISTNFSYLSEFDDVVRIANNLEEFIQFSIEEIETDSIEKKILRKQKALSNSWEQRAEELATIVQQLEAELDLNTENR